MRINIRLCVLFVAAYLLTLVLTVPLNWVLHYANPVLGAQGLTLQQAQGNIWSGSGVLSAPKSPDLNLEWRARPLGLLTAKLPYDVHVWGTAVDVSGQLALRPTGVGVTEISGYIDDAAFASLSRAYNSTLQGRLVISELNATAGWGGSLGDASGELSWSGGPVTIPMGRSVQQFDVPQMKALVTSDDTAWLVAIDDLDDTLLIQAELNRDGQGRVAVQRALAEQLGIPVPGGRETLIEISQKVF